MDLTQPQPAYRFEDGRLTPFADTVVREARVEVDVNDGQARLAMLCLPRDLEALAVGFLLGEGVLRRLDDLASVEVREDQKHVLVRGDFDASALEGLSRRWTWGSGCGGGGTSRDLDHPAYAPVGPGPKVQAQAILDRMREFQAALDLWRATGGVHACALAQGDRILLSAEDVGRHNAFDKIMGLAARRKLAVGECFVITTGRLTAEIVSKAVACRVPILASRGAATSLALELARRFGATLVGFARGGRLNVYTGYERVIAGAESSPGAPT